MSKQTRRKNMGDFDNRIKPYHLTKPWVLKILVIGVEQIADRFSKPVIGEVLATAEGNKINPYAVPQVAKGQKAELPTKQMPVLFFHGWGSRKSFVLNNTNRRTLIEAFGVDPNNWIDKVITLSAGKTPQKKPTVILTVGGDYENQKPALPETLDTETGELQDGEPVELGHLLNPGM